METGGAVKEKDATILRLSGDLLKALGDLQARLDSQFNRTVKGEGEGGKPQSPNALDDIIDNLIQAHAWINQVTTFISREVLPKIN